MVYRSCILRVLLWDGSCPSGGSTGCGFLERTVPNITWGHPELLVKSPREVGWIAESDAECNFRHGSSSFFEQILGPVESHVADEFTRRLARQCR